MSEVQPIHVVSPAPYVTISLFSTISGLTRKAIERKIQELSFNGKSEARRERAKMIENRHWYDRDRKGDFRTGNDREHGRVTILD